MLSGGCFLITDQAKKGAKVALTKHGLLGKGSNAKSSGFKVPDSSQLGFKRVDPAKLEVSSPFNLC